MASNTRDQAYDNKNSSHKVMKKIRLAAMVILSLKI
jgi:hypothetical protein